MITPEFISRDLFMSNDAPRLKRLSKEQWQRLIEEQQNSSMTQSEFCLSKELSLATFYNWKRKLNASEKTATETSPQWIEAPTTSQHSRQHAWDIELELPGNVILRMRQ